MPFLVPNAGIVTWCHGCKSCECSRGAPARIRPSSHTGEKDGVGTFQEMVLALVPRAR